MRRFLIASFACLGLLAPASASANTTVSALDEGLIVSGGGGVGMDIEISSPAADALRVVDLDPIDELATFGPGCTEAPADTVTCTGLTGTRFDAQVYGSTAGDAVAVDPAATFRTELYGGGGGDVLLGGGADDRLIGGLGNDDIDGRGGSDLVDNGFDNSNQPTADDGADIYRDTGASGQDSLNYGFQTVAVRMSVDDTANDGGASGAEGDDIKTGFERLRGTPANDVIVGGAAAETINGSGGDDDLDGGLGADTVEGNEGVDTLRMRDAAADLVIDCDSASSVTQGTGEIAFVDAADPDPLRCEVVDRLGGGAATPTPTATATATGTATATATASATPKPPGFVITGVGTTETVSRMPRLTGKTFDAARNQALREIAFADVDITFKRDCKNGQFLDVFKQSPLPNKSLPNSSSDPVAVNLSACIAEADFLRDCDLESLRADVKKVGKTLDAEVATGIVNGLNRCKVDYDVKLAKAAEEAKIKLAAQAAEKAAGQAADKVKAELRAGITCPIGGDLRIVVTDGYTPNPNYAGLRSDGPDAWTIPAGLRSAVELQVLDRALQFPEATVYVDSDTVNPQGAVSKRTTVDGHTTFTIEPLRTGKVRLCVVQESGADAVVSAGLEIEVVAEPKAGTTYDTVGGRSLKIVGGGAKGRIAARPIAQPAFFGGIWQAIVDYFSGTSRTVTEQAASPAPVQKKTETTAQVARKGIGQVSLNGELVPKPPPVQVVLGTLVTINGQGQAAASRGPVLYAPNGNGAVGVSNDGKAVFATGEGGTVTATDALVVPRGKGFAVNTTQLIGNDGSTLIGNDGSTLIGNDGSTLIGNDGSTLIGNDGSTLIGNDGSTFTAATAGYAIGPAPAPLIGNDGSTFAPGLASGLVPPGGLK